MVDDVLFIVFAFKFFVECIIMYFTLRKNSPEIKEILVQDLGHLRNLFNLTKQKIRDIFQRRR